mgnify:CR=1 FL=1
MIKDSKCAICGGILIENGEFDGDNEGELIIDMSCSECGADVNYIVDMEELSKHDIK